MLKYFFEKKLINYPTENVTDWKEAIQESCRLLLEKEMINQDYVDEIIACVEEYGPYIVIVPNVAMPHSSENSTGVFDTAVSFTKFKTSINFPNPDEEKKAILFFTLAAKNPEEHMTNIQNLSDLLMTEGLIEDLMETDSINDFEKVMEKYNT